MLETDRYKLYNGDCLEVMDKMIDEGIKVDLILTDPPYELDNHGKGKNDFKDRKLVKENHIKDISEGFDYEETFSRMLKLQDKVNMLIFCSNEQISKIMNYFENNKEKKKLSVTLLVWKKSNPIPLCWGKYISDAEFIIYVRGKGATFNNKADISKKYKVKKYPVINAKKRLHPAQKPVELLMDLIELHSLENQTVLDCFMGSGSTGEGCLRLNRKFIGIDNDKENFNVTKERLENFKEINKIC